MADTPPQYYTVYGMTCDHCVRAVTAELRALKGVADVQVDLSSGRVGVTADQPVTTPSVRAAIEEAGYTLAS